VLREALTGAGDRPGLSWLVLCAWAIAMPIAAAASFKWE
jgi:hypothetical protein